MSNSTSDADENEDNVALAIDNFAVSPNPMLEGDIELQVMDNVIIPSAAHPGLPNSESQSFLDT